MHYFDQGIVSHDVWILERAPDETKTISNHICFCLSGSGDLRVNDDL